MRRSSLVPFVRGSILSARRAAAAEAARRPVDVLHLHQPLSGYGVLTSPLGRGVRSIYTFLSAAPLEYLSRRGMTVHHRGGIAGGLGTALLWTIERACLRRATLIHVLSDFSAHQLQTLYRVPAERIVKIPGGVDTAKFIPATDRNAVRAALGLPPDRRVLLSIRNLEHRMGLDLLIRAVALLKGEHPDLLLLIGGAGSRRGELAALASEIGLGGHIRFLGFLPEAALPLYYQAADAFVLPTRELEGFGLVTVESLACGTPVLGTPIGATPEILSTLSPSLLFRDASPEAMADGLRVFLNGTRRDESEYRRLRDACRRHVEAHYDWNQAVTSLEATFCGLVERGTQRH